MLQRYRGRAISGGRGQGLERKANHLLSCSANRLNNSLRSLRPARSWSCVTRILAPSPFARERAASLVAADVNLDARC